MTPDVLLVCGVGGVGKTTIASALALGHASAGRRVVLVTIDPARRLASALGVAVGGAPTPVPTGGPGSLDAQMVDQQRALDDVVRRLHPDPERAERLLAHRYYRAISERLAGAPEYLALETLWQLCADGRWDLVVVDTPPASDALDVLRAPRRLARVFGPPVLRVLLRPSSRLARVLSRSGLSTLERLVGGTVLRDIGGFFELVQGLSGALADHARDVARILGSDAASSLLVVDADDPDRADTSGFADALVREGPAFGGIVVNRVAVDPGQAPEGLDPPAPADLDPAAWRAALGSVLDHAAREGRRAARHRTAVARLAKRGARVWWVPDVAQPPTSLERLAALAADLPPQAPPEVLAPEG